MTIFFYLNSSFVVLDFLPKIEKTFATTFFNIPNSAVLQNAQKNITFIVTLQMIISNKTLIINGPKTSFKEKWQAIAAINKTIVKYMYFFK